MLRPLRWSIGIATALVLTACADFNEYRQPPAPVYGGYPDNYPRYPRYPAPTPPPVTQTKPLEGMNSRPDMVEITPDIPPSSDTVILRPDENGNAVTESGDPFAATQPDEGIEVMPPSEAPAEQPAAEVAPPQAPPLPEVKDEQAGLKPLEKFSPQTPAVNSLLMAANENSAGGNLDAAVSSIERAIRIEPRNAALYYKLAVLRLKQSKPRLAEDIARKAAILAVNDTSLKKHSWLLIANAREQQNNQEGARQAKAEASKY